jgi:acyl-CoA synthetase (AMP-forming)/AMP-acid ligase II
VLLSFGRRRAASIVGLMALTTRKLCPHMQVDKLRTACDPDRTFLDVFDDHAVRTPDKTAIIFLGDGRSETDKISYARLRARAFGIGNRLKRAGLSGLPVLLVYPPGIEFLVAMLGCFQAGAIAVPAPYPVPSRAWSRTQVIAKDAGPKAVLTISELALKKDTICLDATLADLVWMATDAIDGCLAPDAPAPGPAAIALVQYSSGSTNAPKGVAISHANLVHNQDMLKAIFGHGPDLIVVNW